MVPAGFVDWNGQILLSDQSRHDPIDLQNLASDFQKNDLEMTDFEHSPLRIGPNWKD